MNNPKDPSPKHPGYTVIVGDPATGKTLNQEALRTHYQCAEIMECSEDTILLEPESEGRVLILTTNPDLKVRFRDFSNSYLTGTRTSIEAAKAELEDKGLWVEPKEPEVSRTLESDLGLLGPVPDETPAQKKVREKIAELYKNAPPYSTEQLSRDTELELHRKVEKAAKNLLAPLIEEDGSHRNPLIAPLWEALKELATYRLRNPGKD